MAASRCFIFKYFLLTHCVPATWRSWAQISIRAEFPSGKSAHYPSTAANLPVEPLNDIVGADACPVFAGKIAVGKRFLNAILHFLGGLFQLYTTQLLHHSVGFLTGSFLALPGRGSPELA